MEIALYIFLALFAAVFYVAWKDRQGGKDDKPVSRPVDVAEYQAARGELDQILADDFS